MRLDDLLIIVTGLCLGCNYSLHIASGWCGSLLFISKLHFIYCFTLVIFCLILKSVWWSETLNDNKAAQEACRGSKYFFHSSAHCVRLETALGQSSSADCLAQKQRGFDRNRVLAGVAAEHVTLLASQISGSADWTPTPLKSGRAEMGTEENAKRSEKKKKENKKALPENCKMSQMNWNCCKRVALKRFTCSSETNAF